MLFGTMRVTKADKSQVFDRRRDALVETGRLYNNQTSGRRDVRTGLDSCLKAPRKGDTLAALARRGSLP